MDLDKHIRKISDYPQKGVLFYDITTALEKGQVLRYMVDELLKPFVGLEINKVVGIDARGFLFAAAVAYKIGAGVCLVRKKGNYHIKQ